MRNIKKYRGFSLTEVLLAVGTLAIGMIFIGGTFLTGIHFATISTERTIAAVAADEAFSKIKLYSINLTDPNLVVDQLTPFEDLSTIAVEEFAYPSVSSLSEKQYYWSALSRLVDSDSANRLVQVTVFVSRKVGNNTTYPGNSSRPIPVKVNVSTVTGAGNENKLTITLAGEEIFINDGSTIADHQTGQLYRVLKRDPAAPNVVLLDKEWLGNANSSVWVVHHQLAVGGILVLQYIKKLSDFK